MTLHQVHRLVQLALGATAVGFAALAGTFRKSAPKKPLAGGRLGNAGPEVAFGGREFGADERLGHVLYYTLYKIRKESKSKNTIRICSSLASGLKHQSNQMSWLAKELGCGIAGFFSDVHEKSAGKRTIGRLPFQLFLLRKVLCSQRLAG